MRYEKGDRVRIISHGVLATVIGCNLTGVTVLVDGYECSNSFLYADVEAA